VTEFSPLLAFALTALVIEITPGPNMTYLVALSLSSGLRAGLAAVAGIALGLLTYGIIATFGLAAAIDDAPLLYEVLRWGGVLFLLWLAWESWTGSNETTAGASQEPPWAAFRRGLITNLLNPKAAAFYIAVLPEFIQPARGTVARQTLVLSLIYVAVATLVHATLVLLAGSLQSTIVTADNRNNIKRAFALILVGIALWFALTTGRSTAR
jgi:threonine/homoserine/homoserine lactone efflux protein